MEIKKLEAAIEAILFTMGNSVELAQIADAIQQDKETTRKILQNMMDRYQQEDRGIQIIELEQSYQMCSKKEYYEYLIRLAMHPKKPALTDVMLETLSIIAYKQPVTKAEIEKIRGVKCDHAINKLVEYELVRELGRLDAPGRPILFGTTEEFLRCFGVQGLEDAQKPLGKGASRRVGLVHLRQVGEPRLLGEAQLQVSHRWGLPPLGQQLHPEPQVAPGQVVEQNIPGGQNGFHQTAPAGLQPVPVGEGRVPEQLVQVPRLAPEGHGPALPAVEGNPDGGVPQAAAVHGQPVPHRLLLPAVQQPGPEDSRPGRVLCPDGSRGGTPRGGGE